MPIEVVDDSVGGFRLRDYQRAWRDNAEIERRTCTRLGIDAPGGVGKTSVFAAIALQEWNDRLITGRTGRTLVLENRDALVRQTADRVRNETGLEVDIEMADDHASPYVPVIVASVQSLGKSSRLTGFADNHFSLVVPDEAHFALAPQWQKVMNYFHYGAESLNENWEKPEDGTYTPKAHIIGTTATWDIGTKRSLGEFFKKFIEPRYSYLQAVDDGWLVPPIAKRVPVEVDLRKLRVGRSPNGKDFRAEDMSAVMIPIVEKLAEQIKLLASDRKTIAFGPSVEFSRLLAEAVTRQGLRGIFVSGDCLDKDEKTEEFEASGPGTVLCNCALYVAGKDFPDVDCVAWFRATLSSAFYKQGVYRGTRVLPGLVNDDMTAAERRAAIAGSRKPNMLILDPMFRSDLFNLCAYYDLLTDNPKVKALMKAGADGDEIIAQAKKAERDWLAALAKEQKKHEKKLASAINPLAWGLSMGADKLATYVPQASWEAAPPSKYHLEFLEKNGFNPALVKCAGQANLVIGVIVERERLKLATPKQMDFIKSLTKKIKAENGVDFEIVPMFTEEQVALMPKGQAGAIFGRMKAKWAQ